MKLLYIHQYFLFPEQNGGTRSYDLATSFVKRGIKVTVLSSNTKRRNEGKRWEIFEREGIKFYILNCEYDNRMSFYRRIWAFLYFMWFSSIKALQLNCDFVLATSTPLTIAIPAIIKKIFSGTPFVFEVRDVWPDVPVKMGIIKNKFLSYLLYEFEKNVYKKASWVVPLSVGMKNNICSRIDIDKFTIIPNISEITRFHIENGYTETNINEKIVLYAGTIGEVNGLGYLIDLAVMTLKLDATIKYYIYGEGKYKEELILYAKKMNVLNSNVYFKESVPKSDLPELYASCTVGSSFVINNPILWDNSANKFFDSLAASRPILINYLGWQAEVIQKYNIGYVLEPLLTEKIASDFVIYINNASLLSIQRSNALKLAEKEYSLDNAVEKYMKIFESIVKVIK